MSILVDDSRFKAALQEYQKHSSRTLPQILNAKQQDLMFKAAKETPITTMSAAQFNAEIRQNPAVATARANAQFGKGGWTKEQRAEIWRKMQKSRLGKGFMRSAFIKAGKAIKGAIVSRPGKQSAPPMESGQPSRATVTEATPTRMETTAKCQWQARDSNDAGLKNAILEKSLSDAVGIVAADMWKYIGQKLSGKAKQVSGK